MSFVVLFLSVFSILLGLTRCQPTPGEITLFPDLAWAVKLYPNFISCMQLSKNLKGFSDFIGAMVLTLWLSKVRG